MVAKDSTLGKEVPTVTANGHITSFQDKPVLT
jgi:hypothetical protein